MQSSILGLLSIICVAFATEYVRYDDFKVYKLMPRSHAHLDSLRNLENGGVYNFWSDIGYVNKSVHIMVPPHMRHNFNDFLKLTHIEHELYIGDVQKLIDNENAKPKSPKFGWDNYYRLNEIHDWLKAKVNQYPNILELIEGGQSYEGRKILGVKLSFSKSNSNRGIFLEGGIHAREWYVFIIIHTNFD